LTPLRELAAALPPGLPGSALVTMHVGEHARSRLPACCRGGLVVVQEPEEAAQPSMPRAALAAAPGAVAMPGGRLGEVVIGPLSLAADTLAAVGGGGQV